MIQSLLARVQAGEDLSLREMTEVMHEVMQGHCSETEITRFLLALNDKGATVDEVAGAAAALRQHMTPIRSSRQELLDTCGTGGDRSGTFNISTAAALVTAAAGVPVAKHGNRGMTSKSGSADVLAALGVNIQASVEIVQRCLDELGICFCFAPLMHPSMKHVAAVRRNLGVPTIFNLLGPLCNPAGAPYQLLGVGRAELRPLLAAAMLRLGTRRCAVVCGDDALDEVTLGGPTHVSLIAGDTIQEFTWTPAQFGLANATLEPLLVDGPADSALLIQRVLNGEQGTPRDIVVINSAAALWIAGKSPDLTEAAARAAEAIDCGAARQLLSSLAQLSHASPH